jgi:DNA-binding NarL/FixJ family response regulator
LHFMLFYSASLKKNKYMIEDRRNSMYKVVIADDHPVVREGLVKIVNRHHHFSITGEAENGNKLLELLEVKECDLVLIDIEMPHLDGMKAIEIIKRKYPAVKVVIITMHANKQYFDRTLKADADGYLLKDDSSQTILSALCAVMNGCKMFSPRLQKHLADKYLEQRSPFDLLTKREMEVFKHIAAGRTSREIAVRLDISMSTVEFHKKNLKDKLDAKNLAQLLTIAYKYNLVTEYEDTR